jgi:hypothetical protein
VVPRRLDVDAGWSERLPVPQRSLLWRILRIVGCVAMGRCQPTDTLMVGSSARRSTTIIASMACAAQR